MFKKILGIVLVLALMQGFSYSNNLDELETEHSDGKYNIMIDENNRVLQRTALPIYAGDEFIAPDNKHYKVVRVLGTTAFAKYMKTENIAWKEEWDALPALKNEAQKQLKVAIYHTHSDESYVPTDGTYTIPAHGGIYKVGNIFTDKLEKLKYNVIHSLAAHEPHDAGAYHRSRRTAVALLKQKPDALIDVHRDAVPPDVYRKQLKGEEVTQVKLVVGRRNPTMSNNLEFAKILKAAMDKTNPGLFEGIFLAKGSYNQELSPRAILIEVGAHTNSRYEAQKGVDLFGDALPKAIGVSKSLVNVSNNDSSNTLPVKLDKAQNKSGWSAAIWLMIFVIVGGTAFLLLSTGSWQSVKNALGKEMGRKK